MKKPRLKLTLVSFQCGGVTHSYFVNAAYDAAGKAHICSKVLADLLERAGAQGRCVVFA